METETIEKKIEGLKKFEYKIQGLGGWLVVVQIMIYLNLVLIPIGLLALMSDTMQEQMEYIKLAFPEYMWLIWFGTVFSIIMIVVLIWALICMYRKKKIFPKLMIAINIATFVVDFLEPIAIISLMNTNGDFEIWKDTIRSGIYCAIIIPYFLKSTRVKNTFVN
ncbi:DUF2569 domain-containing protein [Paenibacillus agilis]|uniref:DUF2569 domain-containing protein n=1 Tax=Paenibacillus agilis TaxID=3020863 RepID=A0A559J128_9BACL|nr:DUF2569 domain-containing protein [Paenibacillus agilis]TVX93598.1 DUF2569 domain-containing protein [Paenibacillus agilis]